MKGFQIVLLIFLIIYSVIFLFFFLKIKNGFRYFCFHGIASIIILAVINLTTFVSGMHVPVNYGTITGTLLGGVPFLGGILLLKSIFPL